MVIQKEIHSHKFVFLGSNFAYLKNKKMVYTHTEMCSHYICYCGQVESRIKEETVTTFKILTNMRTQ